MKHWSFTAMPFVTLLLFSGSLHACDFSADTIMTSEGHTMTGKMFSKGEKFRMEVTTPEKMITITRMDKKASWTLMPSEKMHMEMPLDPKTAPKTEIRGEIERKLVGSETINGHPAIKYLVTYKEDGETAKVYQWMATDINFPVKTADVNGRWVQEYRNVKIGPQPEVLFELPSGYQKMQIPAMPGGMR